METSNRPYPQSSALKTAQPESLQELFSRDPESYSIQDLESIIYHMRSIREKLAQSESVRQPRAKARVPRGLDDVSEEDF
jgi:hypothetical protein